MLAVCAFTEAAAGGIADWPPDGQDQVGNWILLSFVFFYLPALFVERPSEI